MFCHNHEAITTLSPLPGQGALREESGCSTRKALPGPSFSAPSTSSWSRWAELLRIYHRRSGRHMQAVKTHDSCTVSSLFFGQYLRSDGARSWEWERAHKTRAVSDLLSLCLSQQPQVGRWRCTRAGMLRGDDAAWSSLLQVRVLQKKLARHDCVCIFCGRWFCSSGWTAAAALGLLRWAPFTVEGQLLGGSQDTRDILAISQVCVVCH